MQIKLMVTELVTAGDKKRDKNDEEQAGTVKMQIKLMLTELVTDGKKIEMTKSKIH